MNKHSSLYRKRLKNGRRRQKRFRKGKARKTYERIKVPFQISIFNYCFNKGIDTLKFEQPLFVGGNHQFADQIIDSFTAIPENDRNLMKLLSKDGQPREEIIHVISDLNKLRGMEPSEENKTKLLELIEELVLPKLSVEGKEAVRQWLAHPDK